MEPIIKEIDINKGKNSLSPFLPSITKLPNEIQIHAALEAVNTIKVDVRVINKNLKKKILNSFLSNANIDKQKGQIIISQALK